MASYGQLWPPGPALLLLLLVAILRSRAFNQNRVEMYILFIILIRLPASNSVPFFFSFKEGPDHYVQNRPGPGSDLDGLVRFWADESGPEVSRCASITVPVSFTTQLARYQCPTFTLGYVLPQTARIIFVDRFYIALCSALEQTHCARV